MSTAKILAAAASLSAAVAVGLALMSSASLAAGSLPALRLTLHGGKSVSVAGSKGSGAVDVITMVTGEPAGEPILFLLKPGVTAATLFKVATALGNAPIDGLDPYAAIVFDADAPQGTSSAQTVLQPGRYVAADFDSPKPIGTAFTVTRSAHPASLPKPGATVTAIDFAFRGPSTLHDGELVRFQNDGYLVHMFAWGSTKSAADATQAEALLLAGKANAAAKIATAMGMFAGPLSTGAMQQQVITEPAGFYVLYCGMNAQDGRDHYQLGMFRTMQIVR
jgi:hypothetical protein